MPILKYQNRSITMREGETVLDALLRQGIEIPFSCRNGVCQVCLRRCMEGEIPPAAQRGLSPELREQDYFLACQCIPSTDMEAGPPAGIFAATLVHAKEMLAPDVCRLLLEPPPAMAYAAGQFINLRRADGLTRSYSIASVPAQDYFLELHVQRTNGGAMSNWIFDELKPGDDVAIQGASGDCRYDSSMRAQPMLMICSGTGLAPLYGILRDALQQAHAGDIHLYHASRGEARFYLRDVLHELESRHPNFHYHECLSGTAHPPPGIYGSGADEVAFARHHDLHHWQVFAAGPAELVDECERLAAMHGARPQAIHSDAFVLRDLRKAKRGVTQSSDEPAETAKYPPTDPELWKALREGPLLSEILTDFYTRVYQDDKLASFFDGVTKQRLIEKQYLFMRQILTGEKIYFGDRPRNTHHWMVVSDDLFDYRSHIMKSCLRGHGLSEAMVRRYMAVEEFYRADIVKPAPIPRLVGDIERPLEGFDELVMDVGTLCDVCQREVAAGEKVIYHVRLGKIYCADCSETRRHELPA